LAVNLRLRLGQLPIGLCELTFALTSIIYPK